MSLTKEDAKRIREACDAREYSGPGSVATGANGLCVYADELIGSVEIASIDDEGMAAFFAIAQEIMPQVPDLIDEVERRRAEAAEARVRELEAELHHARRDDRKSRDHVERMRAGFWEQVQKAQAERDEAREQRDALAAWMEKWRGVLVERFNDCGLGDGQGAELLRGMEKAPQILADRIRRERAEAFEGFRVEAMRGIKGIKGRVPRRRRERGIGDMLINAELFLRDMPNPYRDGGDDD